MIRVAGVVPVITSTRALAWAVTGTTRAKSTATSRNRGFNCGPPLLGARRCVARFMSQRAARVEYPGRWPHSIGIGSDADVWRYLRWRCRMDLTGLVVDVVILLVIVAIVFSVARAWRTRPARARLTALPSEARARYVLAWERIEKRFMDAPEEAV